MLSLWGKFIQKLVEPNKNYVKAITEFPTPNNRNELLRVLGMAKYLGKFVPNMSKITAPLRDLTRQDISWLWSDVHKESLSQLKHLLTSAPILRYFDSKKEIVIETDASKDGLGACLLQEGHPVAWGKRNACHCVCNSEIPLFCVWFKS